MTAFNLDHYALFIGLDVGKSQPRATALTAEGTRVLVVDQPATSGALPVAVAQTLDAVEVAYLPGLTMRPVADLHTGNAKTNARDPDIIAATARTMPATLRAITVSDEQIAELAVPAGFDDDLLAPTTATRNRLRNRLTQIHPGLERVVGPKFPHPGVLDALTRWPTPHALETAGRGHMRNRIAKHNPRLAAKLTEAIFEALDAQRVVVPGTSAATTIVPMLASQLAELYTQGAAVLSQVEALVDAHPLSAVLTSMPGVAVRTAARLLTEVIGKEFKSAGHLAS